MTFTQVLCAIGIACAALLPGRAMASAPAEAPPARPTATIVESATGGGRSGGTFFFVASIDGQNTSEHILRASLRASSGRYANLRLAPFERTLPAGKVRLKLALRHAYAMPIQTAFHAASNIPLEAEVDVDLAAGTTYRVTGVLDAFRKEVWIEEAGTGRVLGEKILASRQPDALKAMEGARYTCCNLRYDDDWVSDANWTPLPMVPAGSRIKILEYGKDRATALVEGRRMRIGLEYGMQHVPLRSFIDRMLVDTDPRDALRALPDLQRTAIEKGLVVVGMTRPQVLMSLGYPRADTTPSLDADRWVFWTLDEEPYTVEWDAAGLVSAVKASDKVRALVELRP